jgi:hypothetical protein
MLRKNWRQKMSLASTTNKLRSKPLRTFAWRKKPRLPNKRLKQRLLQFRRQKKRRLPGRRKRLARLLPLRRSIGRRKMQKRRLLL